MENKERKDFYTVEELAERWQVTGRAIRNWIAEGAFPNAYKLGPGSRSHFRVPAKDVEVFEKARNIYRP